MANGFRQPDPRCAHLPGYIEALLFCCWSGLPWTETGRKDTPTVRLNFAKLGADGLIWPKGPGNALASPGHFPVDWLYELTPRGDALVEHILNLPLPVKTETWEMPS